MRWGLLRCRAWIYPELKGVYDSQFGRCDRVIWHRHAHADRFGNRWSRFRKGVRKI